MERVENDLAIAGMDESATTDAGLEEEGAWCACPYIKGAEFLIRSGASLPVQNMAAKQQQKHYATIRANQIVPIEAQRKDLIDRLAKVVVVDWRGVFRKTDGTTPIPCTPINVRALLTSSRPIREWVVNQADSAENFIHAQTEGMAED